MSNNVSASFMKFYKLSSSSFGVSVRKARILLGAHKSEILDEICGSLGSGVASGIHAPKCVIKSIIASEKFGDIGGGIQEGFAGQDKNFHLGYSVSPLEEGKSRAVRTLVGLDIDKIGPIGKHIIGGFGLT